MEFPWQHSRLRMLHCYCSSLGHCCGDNQSLALELSHAENVAKKEKKKKKKAKEEKKKKKKRKIKT